MRAVTCTQSRLDVVDLPEPEPGRGQVVLEVDRCGICGSDLHARYHSDELADVLSETGYKRFMRLDQRVVFGHEFAGRVLDFGPACRRREVPGTAVVAFPLVRSASGVDPVGLSAGAPGAYAERVVVEESLMMRVPNGLAPEVAALTEPMAVALHAVRRGEVSRRSTAVVVGCGPIGLAVIIMLKARGVRTVVASDLSARRRELARACGADTVVDPAGTSPFSAAAGKARLESVEGAGELLLATMEKLGRVPGAWPHVLRAADKLGLGPQGPVVFECVGVPGMIDQIVAGAPLGSRVVVAGVCMGADRFRPSMAVNKQIDLRFVVGYTPVEFRDTLHMLAEGKVDPGPLVTATVGLEGVEPAFEALATPDAHAKILIDPASPAGLEAGG
jgi:threonine dehydrogenase-like Zn-dependent dehydrogenase